MGFRYLRFRDSRGDRRCVGRDFDLKGLLVCIAYSQEGVWGEVFGPPRFSILTSFGGLKSCS